MVVAVGGRAGGGRPWGDGRGGRLWRRWCWAGVDVGVEKRVEKRAEAGGRRAENRAKEMGTVGGGFWQGPASGGCESLRFRIAAFSNRCGFDSPRDRVVSSRCGFRSLRPRLRRADNQHARSRTARLGAAGGGGGQAAGGVGVGHGALRHGRLGSAGGAARPAGAPAGNVVGRRRPEPLRTPVGSRREPTQIRCKDRR